MSLTEPLSHVIQSLSVSAELLHRNESEAEDTRKGVLLFTANALQAATEIQRTSSEPIAGWMVVRTLWHNTGCLSLFLLDARGHRKIATLLDLDSDRRAKQILVDEPIRIMGQPEAEGIFSMASFAPEAIEELARNAGASTPSGGGWKNIRVQALRKAMETLCEQWRLKNDSIGHILRVFVDQSDIARTRGDSIAHPNLFGVQTLLQVVDLENGRICIDPEMHSSDPRLREFAAIQLLLLHAAVIALQFPGVLDFEQLLETTTALLPGTE